MTDYLAWSIFWSLVGFYFGYLVGLIECELCQRRHDHGRHDK